MPREFIINSDPSWISGSTGSGVLVRPFIQHAATVHTLKNTGYYYNMFVGSVATSEKDSFMDTPANPMPMVNLPSEENIRVLRSEAQTSRLSRRTSTTEAASNTRAS
jgi:hypothetical protein